MSSSQSLREFIRERLTAAAENIFSEFDKTIVHYEEELDRQRRLLEISCKPQINLQRTDLTDHYLFKEDNFFSAQQFSNQETNSHLDQEDPEPQQTSEKQEDLGLRQFIEIHEDVKPQMKENLGKCETLGMEEEQEVRALPQIKDEQEELCVSLEKQQLELKWEAGVNPMDEESDYKDPVSNTDQLLVLEKQKQKRGSNEDSEKRRCPKIRRHSANADDSEVGIQKNEHIMENLASRKVCSKGFDQLYLTKNVRTNDKPFLCTTCGKGFTVKSSLRFHLRSHTGERPFSCTTCGKSFAYSNYLIHHMGVHTSEKPFSCSTCGRNFKYRQNLYQHTKTHRSEKPFTCLTCGKGFLRMSHLTRHVRTHIR
uniref:Zinc finger protein 37 homolog n=1 Tax=Fundulus heteroclitus TaxID=8078 RepID=A0A3Q2QJS4_FUNHE